MATKDALDPRLSVSCLIDLKNKIFRSQRLSLREKLLWIYRWELKVERGEHSHTSTKLLCSKAGHRKKGTTEHHCLGASKALPTGLLDTGSEQAV